jgi:transglutaminase-like putative cysteine protease
VRYKVRHQTRYRYSEQVLLSHSLVTCEPRNTDYQRCLQSETWFDPLPQHFDKRRDALGNWVGYFSLEEPHAELSVVCRSLVEVQPRLLEPLPALSWEALAERLRSESSLEERLAHQFLYPSQAVRPIAAAADYARPSFAAQRSAWEATWDLTRRIYRDFHYLPGSTAVHTPVEEVLQQRRGVCQDFAHVMLCGLRAFGLACRYVSGYLLTTPPPGQPRLVGADASHAWVSVWFPELGWVDFDPTNQVLCGTQHIVLAWGRDYPEVAPVRGVVLGGGEQTVEVAVDVTPVEEESA